jgi:hypothetical protein
VGACTTDIVDHNPDILTRAYNSAAMNHTHATIAVMLGAQDL